MNKTEEVMKLIDTAEEEMNDIMHMKEEKEMARRLLFFTSGFMTMCVMLKVKETIAEMEAIDKEKAVYKLNKISTLCEDKK